MQRGFTVKGSSGVSPQSGIENRNLFLDSAQGYKAHEVRTDGWCDKPQLAKISRNVLIGVLNNQTKHTHTHTHTQRPLCLHENTARQSDYETAKANLAHHKVVTSIDIHEFYSRSHEKMSHRLAT